jgi:hypothetical protein
MVANKSGLQFTTLRNLAISLDSDPACCSRPLRIPVLAVYADFLNIQKALSTTSTAFG